MPKARDVSASVISTDCIVNYPEALCRQQKSKADNSTFRCISFKVGESWASFPLSEDAVSQSTNRNGKVIPHKLALNLGDSDDVRFVSVREGDSYKRKAFFNKTIQTLIDNEKRAYLRSIAL